MITEKEVEEEPVPPRSEAEGMYRIRAGGQASHTKETPISKGGGKREEEDRSMV